MSEYWKFNSGPWLHGPSWTISPALFFLIIAKCGCYKDQHNLHNFWKKWEKIQNKFWMCCKQPLVAVLLKASTPTNNPLLLCPRAAWLSMRWSWGTVNNIFIIFIIFLFNHLLWNYSEVGILPPTACSRSTTPHSQQPAYDPCSAQTPAAEPAFLC